MRSKSMTFIIAIATISLTFLLIMASTAHAAQITISDNAVGGDCSQIGVWDNVTNTCTMNKDYLTAQQDAIEINSNGVTLDGSGYTIWSYGPGQVATGVSLGNKSNVVVKNLTIVNFNIGISIPGTYPSGSIGNNLLQGNTFIDNSTGIWADMSANNNFVGNNIDSFASGIALYSSGNTVSNNLITAPQYGIMLTGDNNAITGNTIKWANHGIYMQGTVNGALIYSNNFIGNTVQAQDEGSGNSFYFSFFGAHWGNYWSNYDTPVEGCVNTTFNDQCDNQYTIDGSSPATDDYTYLLQGGWNRYDFTWYDNVGGMNWILAANPAGDPKDLWMDLSVGGIEKTLPSLPGYASGQIPSGKSVAAIYPGLIGGPVRVSSREVFASPVVSQRILWGSNSLEEVPGTWAYDMSDNYWWPWYDQKTPGYQNWVMISNPNSFDVYARIYLGNSQTPVWADVIPAGESKSPQLNDTRGGPVRVEADVNDLAQDKPAKVQVSQRVLSNGGSAFNEVPGIPAGKLSDYYYWTWYDMATPGAQNWIMIANPSTNTQPLLYDIYIGDEMVVNGSFLTPSETIPVGGYVFRTFPGKIGGPVQVLTYYDGGAPANSIATQRSVWGPSFEEVPGAAFSRLQNAYDWTWYDEKSPGAQNWVMVANPNDFIIRAFVDFTDQATGSPVHAQQDIAAGDNWTPSFAGKMGGPVKVRAVNAGTLADADVIASQRVVWNGYFNEVWGQ